MSDEVTQELEHMPLLAATAMFAVLLSMLLHRQGKQLLTLPLVRNFIFMMSVLVINYRHHSETRCYASDIGDDDSALLTLGGIPFEVDASDPAITDEYAAPLLDKLLAPSNSFGLVVSMVQPHEQSGAGIGLFCFRRRPVQPAMWREHGVAYLNVPVQDFTADFDANKSVQALVKMRSVIDGNKRVYVHCQAGEGRGFIMTMSYLVTYGLPYRNTRGEVQHQALDYEEALAIVKTYRPHVSVSPIRRATIERIADAWRKSDSHVSCMTAKTR